MKYSYSGNINTAKLFTELSEFPIITVTTEDQTVFVHMERELSLEEKESMDTIVQNHNPIDINFIKRRVESAMQFGRDLMAEYGASNVILGLTNEQIKHVISITKDLQLALNAGSLYVALDEIELIEVDGIILTNEIKTEFRNKIQDYLGIERT